MTMPAMPPPPRPSRWPRRFFILAVLAALVFAYSLGFHPEREDWPGQRSELAGRTLVTPPARFDQVQVLDDVRALASPAMQGRAVGTPGGKAAREFILARFRSLGLEPGFGRSYEQPFRFVPSRGIRFWSAKFWSTPRPLDGVNLAGIVRGSADPSHYIVVSAHYDHLGERNGKLYPGADDNASGVAAMLAAARWFSANPPRHSIMFVAFDAEERGMKGSEAFLEKPPVPLSQMLVDLNLDMVSRNADGEIFAVGTHQNPQLQDFVAGMRRHAKPTIIFGHDRPRPFWNMMEDWTDQSDQGSFADKGVPFLYLGVADHPDYHQPTDTFEHIDQPFFLGVVGSVIDIVKAMDGAENPRLRERKQPKVH